jgi:hypothetical protein
MDEYKEDEDVAKDLAQWLKEAGRRTKSARPEVVAIPLAADARAMPGERRSASLKRILVVALLAGSGYQYYYADLMLQISSLPSVVVFVPVPGQT